MFPYGANSEVVRVKAKLITEDGCQVPHSKKFSLDPVITSFEMIQSLLAKAFEIRGEFSICYLAVDDEENLIRLPVLNDWDLDAAILSSADPSLKLVIQAKPYDEALNDWDVIAPLDIPAANTDSNEAVKNNGFLGSITERISSIGNFSKRGKKSKPEDVKRIKAPMSDAEFRNFLDCSGKLIGVREFRESIYHGGVEPSLRKVAWRHLLSIFPEDLTGEERVKYLKKKSQEYASLKSEWKEEMKQSRITEEIRFVTSMVKKDVVRTDRTHPFYKGKEDNKNILSLFDLLVTYSLNHPEVSYCQGMSDLASPLLVVQGHEAHAYICFCALMRHLKSNFLFDSKAMTCKFEHLTLLLKHYDSEFYAYMQQNEVDDLFFTYRWLLLELKREFPFDDALYMLEVLWSCMPHDPPMTELSLRELTSCTDTSSHQISSQLSPCSTITGSIPGSGPGTPYSKLLTTVRRNSVRGTFLQSVKDVSPELSSLESTRSNSPSPTDIALVLNSSIRQDMSALAEEIDNAISNNLVHNNHSNHTSPEHTSDNSLLVNGVHDAEQTALHTEQSRFYLALQYSEAGSPFYVCRENEEEDQSSRPIDERGSVSSSDSGIRSRPDSPSKSSSSSARVSPELQFAFESSANHKCMRTPIFPPPHEFGYGNPFLMFAATTMILQHRDLIISRKMDFNDIVLLFSKGQRKNNVHKILHRTRQMYEEYKKSEREQGYSSDLDLSISM